MQTIRDIPSASANIWGAVGQGTGAALQNLANMKMQQVMEQKQAMQTEQGLIGAGIDPKMARQMRSLPPQLLQEAFKYQLKGPSEENFANQLGRIMGDGSSSGVKPAVGSSTSAATATQPISNTARQEQFTELARRLAPAVNVAGMAGMGNRFNVQPQAQAGVQKNITMQEQAGTPQPAVAEPAAQQTTKPALPKRLSANDFRTLVQMYMQKKGMDQKQAIDLAKLDLAKQKQAETKTYHEGSLGIKERQVGAREKRELLAEKTLALQPHLKYNDALDKRVEAANNNKWRFDAMKKLIADPKGLPDPTFYKILSSHGFPASFLGNNAELMEKLSADLKRDLASMTSSKGGAIPVAEFQALEKAYPTLLNKPEGIQTLINLYENARKLDDARVEARNKIMKDYNDIPPREMQSMIEERVSKVRDQVSSKAADIISGVPQVGNYYKTSKDLMSADIGNIIRDNGVWKILDINKTTNKKDYRRANSEEIKRIEVAAKNSNPEGV